MTIASAMAFVGHVRKDDELRSRIAVMGSDASYEGLCAIGREAGFKFSAAELGSAFRIDWTARWLHFSKTPATSA